MRMSETSHAIGRVEAIWMKRAHRGPMDSVPVATLVADRGFADSVDRSRRRQVTLLSREAWDLCMAELGADADPSNRRANILVSGIELAHTRGRILRIGDARLAIGGELTPCERMDEVVNGLQDVMRPDWRGGVFAQVVAGGTVRTGDRIAWESVPALRGAAG
jgi:MOSC domain-containing protein YiiM